MTTNATTLLAADLVHVPRFTKFAPREALLTDGAFTNQGRSA